MKLDIKYKNNILKEITDISTVELDTKETYLSGPIIFDVKEAGIDTSDATATAADILANYTGYISDGSKATGTLSTWNGELSPNYLCFTANAAGSTIGIQTYGYGAINKNFQYSISGGAWFELIPNETVVTLAAVGDKIYLKGDNPNGISTGSLNRVYKFTMDGSISVSGNVMSLIDNGKCNTLTIPNSQCFYQLFAGCPITTAPELPATTLTSNCYSQMFANCSNLKVAPILPALTMEYSCYYGMFDNCISLVTPPALPATILASDCYASMFHNCSTLRVSDTQIGKAKYPWVIPGAGVFTSTESQDGMFADCAGSRTSDDMAGEEGQSYTYYTQNIPVA